MRKISECYRKYKYFSKPYSFRCGMSTIILSFSETLYYNRVKGRVRLGRKCCENPMSNIITRKNHEKD